MTENSRFFSTPKLVSDLLFISDLLKQIEIGERSYFLKEIISKQIEGDIQIEKILKINLNKYSVINVKMFNKDDHSLILLRIQNDSKEYLLLIRLFFPKLFVEEKYHQCRKFSFSYAIIIKKSIFSLHR